MSRFGLRRPRRRPAAPALSEVERLARLSERREWHTEPPEPAFLQMVAQAVTDAGEHAAAGDRQLRLLVVGGADVRPWTKMLRTVWPDVRVVPIRTDADPSATHVRLAAGRALDLILDASDTDAADQLQMFRRVLMHLRAGGVYLAHRALPSEDPAAEDLWSVVSAAQAARLRDYQDHLDQPGFRDVVALARLLRSVESHGRSLRLVTSSRVLAKIREEEVDAVLEARPRLGERLEALPALTWEAGVDYHSNRDETRHVPESFDVPELVLRRYDRATCSRGQVVTTGRLILPATYRHFWYQRLPNVYVVEKAERFGAVPRRLSNAQPLPGAYFHFDCEWPGHFGHLLTDQVSRLWAWQRVRELEPDVKLLTTVQRARQPQELVSFEKEILAAFGVTPEDVHIFDAAVRPERLYSATPMFSLPKYAHPDMAAIWDRIGDHLATGAEARPRADRLFVSRRPSLKRTCHNTPELEALFRAQGFEVVYPEEHTLADQVAMFRAADVVAGFAGSGMFMLAMTSTPKRVLTLAPRSYTARNEYVIAAVRGHQLTALWSEPDLPHPPGGWTVEAFASSFTFDLDDEGKQLQEWFDSLDV